MTSNVCQTSIRRRETVRPPAILEAAREASASRLRARIPGIRIDLDDLLISPTFVHNTYGFLSGPASEEEMLQPRTIVAQGRADPEEPHRPIKRFLDENPELFGYDSGILASGRISREYVTAHNGMRTVVWEQRLDGIAIFDGVLYGHITKNGELVSLCSQFVPRPAQAADAGVPNRLTIQASPSISPERALAVAATNIMESMRAEDVAAVDATPQGPEQKQRFRAAALQGDATASLIWLPTDRNTMKLCWRIILTGKTRGELFQVLVDAQSGEPQVRHCWTFYFTPQAFRVFTSDSPSPLSPGHATPSSVQPPLLGPTPLHGRQLVTLSASSVASPNGWINDGDTRTIGNNVDAHLDVNQSDPLYNDPVNPPRPVGRALNGVLTFDWSEQYPDFPLDLSQSPLVNTLGAKNQDSAVINAFYWCNRVHDRLYELGFTEAAGNFQQNNFGRGGLGGDAILVDVQDSAALGDRNSSAMEVNATDGGGPNRMKLRLFNGPLSAQPPQPERDSALTAEVVLHEYTHGLVQRLVGHGVGIDLGSKQAYAINEGTCDFFALALLSESSDYDTLNANYPMGGWFIYQWGGMDLVDTSQAARLTENFYFGTHRYPYTTDLSKNPLTLLDAARLTPYSDFPEEIQRQNRHLGISRSPVWNDLLKVVSVGGAWAVTVPVDDAEAMYDIWCVTLWEVRANLINKHGFAPGTDLVLRLVMDTLKLSPPNPSFLQARDALLLADRVYTGGANQREIWAAFAKRGMGWGAVCPLSSSADIEEDDIDESFVMPPEGGPAWSYLTGNAVYSSPALGADGTIYVGSTDGKLYALKPNGEKKWEFGPATSYPSFNAAPAVGADGTIYARRNNGFLYALHPDGTLKWSYQVTYDTYASPALGPDGSVYVAGSTSLLALHPNGTLKWSFGTGNTIYSSPAVAADGTVYFGGMNGLMYALDSSGNLKSGWPFNAGAAVASSPAIAADGTIYFGCFNGKLYALYPSGAPRWAAPPTTAGAIDSSPAIGADGIVYVGSQDRKLYAFNPDGTLRWSCLTGFTVRSSPAIGADGTAYVGSYDGKVYALRDAVSVWPDGPFYTGAAIFSSPNIGPDGTVYIGSANGRLYAFTNQAGPARSGWPMFRREGRRHGNLGAIQLGWADYWLNARFQFQIMASPGVSSVNVESSTDLVSWSAPIEVPLVNGTATFLDQTSLDHRFYRVSSGTDRSINPIGFIAKTVLETTSFIANPLNSTNNTVRALFKHIPHGTYPSSTYIIKWNPTTGYDEEAAFVNGVWSGPNFDLLPGEGAIIQNSGGVKFTNLFVGEVLQGYLVNPLPLAETRRSSMVPQSGGMSTALGFVPQEGDAVLRLNAAGEYEIYVYVDQWFPFEPELQLGEACAISPATARNWTRTFTVWPP